ncbi:MAG: lysine biosynthesis protein LysW [Anaerolineae bacterium]|nr:lysine biosynthesis protein LysW [Anaerolineae bacterium]
MVMEAASDLVSECPECGCEVDLPAGTILQEIVVCPDCGMELEVTSIVPPVLEQAPEEEEDWGE